MLECDVSDQASIERLAEQVAGITQHVDLLINNAGIYGQRSQSLTNVSRQVMLDTFNTNSLGPLFVTQAFFNKGLLGGAQRSVVANVTSKVCVMARASVVGAFVEHVCTASTHAVTDGLD